MLNLHVDLLVRIIEAVHVKIGDDIQETRFFLRFKLNTT